MSKIINILLNPSGDGQAHRRKGENMTDIGVNYTYFVFYGRKDDHRNDDMYIGETTCTHSDVARVVALMNEVEEEHTTEYHYYFICTNKPEWRGAMRQKYGYMPLENT